MPQTIANPPCLLPVVSDRSCPSRAVCGNPFPKQPFRLLVYPQPPWVGVFCARLAPRTLPTFSSLLAGMRSSPVLRFYVFWSEELSAKGAARDQPQPRLQGSFGHRRAPAAFPRKSARVVHLLCFSFMCSTTKHGGRFGTSLEKVIGGGKRKMLMLG